VSHPEDPALSTALAAIREDSCPEAGALFVELACRHLDSARGDGPLHHWIEPGTPAFVDRFAGDPPAQGRPLAEVVATIEREVVADCMPFPHPRFMVAPIPSPLPVSAWCEALIGATNQSVRVWCMSPTGTSLEVGLVRWMARLVGWNGEDFAGGTFTSGGTESNFTALLAARARALPDAWRGGTGSAPPVVLAGENVHFSVHQAMSVLGLGTSQLRLVPLRDHRMDPAALEVQLRKELNAGQQVMAVVATAGAWLNGPFDDLEAIGEVCDASGVWLHVDAAIGGTALLSKTHRHRLRGIERARTVAWDLHKLGMMPMQAGVLLARDERDLELAFAVEDRNRPRDGQGPRRWNQVLRTFQSSRRLDALKFWAALLRHGTDGLGAIYDQLCGLAGQFYREVCAHPDFEAMTAPDSTMVVFHYIGPGGCGARESPGVLDKVNQGIWSEAVERGHVYLCPSVIGGHTRLLAVTSNPFLDPADFRDVLDGLAEIGASLWPGPGESATPPSVGHA
jgi:L-2,4-diaminobutyrate decarboxylase